MGDKQKQSSAPGAEGLSFEEAFERLRAIAAALEGESLSLEETLARYEEATGLAAQCQARLEDAAERIKRLQGSGYVPHQVDVSD